MKTLKQHKIDTLAMKKGDNMEVSLLYSLSETLASTGNIFILGCIAIAVVLIVISALE